MLHYNSIQAFANNYATSKRALPVVQRKMWKKVFGGKKYRNKMIIIIIMNQ